MTITTTFQNGSGESPVSVNIAPFPTTWVKTKVESRPSGAQMVESKIMGDDVAYSLVRQVEVRSANLFHPEHPSDVHRGVRRTITLHTTSKVEDSVSGLIQYVPVQVTLNVAVGGPTIDDLADVMQFLLSAVSEFYDSVTTGTPDTSVLSKLGLGAADLD